MEINDEDYGAFKFIEGVSLGTERSICGDFHPM